MCSWSRTSLCSCRSPSVSSSGEAKAPSSSSSSPPRFSLTRRHKTRLSRAAGEPPQEARPRPRPERLEPPHKATTPLPSPPRFAEAATKGGGGSRCCRDGCPRRTPEPGRAGPALPASHNHLLMTTVRAGRGPDYNSQKALRARQGCWEPHCQVAPGAPSGACLEESTPSRDTLHAPARTGAAPLAPQFSTKQNEDHRAARARKTRQKREESSAPGRISDTLQGEYCT